MSRVCHKLSKMQSCDDIRQQIQAQLRTYDWEPLQCTERHEHDICQYRQYGSDCGVELNLASVHSQERIVGDSIDALRFSADVSMQQFPEEEIHKDARCVAARPLSLTEFFTDIGLPDIRRRTKVVSRSVDNLKKALILQMRWEDVVQMRSTKNMDCTTERLCGAPAKPTESVLVKLLPIVCQRNSHGQAVMSGSEAKQFKKHFHEALIHQSICSRRTPGTDWMPSVCGSDIVPKFYCSFLLRHSKYGVVYVIAMEFIDGPHLQEVWSKGKFGIDTLAQVERAVVSLWTLGYTHNDLHMHNILQTTTGIRLIDLQTVQPLPQSMTTQVRLAATPFVDPIELFLQDFDGLKIVMFGKQYTHDHRLPWHWSDGYVLLGLYEKGVRELQTTRPQVQVARLESWWPTCKNPAKFLDSLSKCTLTLPIAYNALRGFI